MPKGSRNPFTSLGWTMVFALGVLIFGSFVIQDLRPSASVAQEDMATIKPIRDGNGMYYFPVAGDQYRRSLGQFYADNPGLVCEYQGATDEYASPSFRISGHILHCRDAAMPAQDLTVP
mgnify:CR=1 FL=1